jgi:hypothetical protein
LPHRDITEVHVFYLALGYFISYLSYAALAKALSGGALWVDDSASIRMHCPADTDTAEPAVASPDDHRLIAALIQQAVQKQLAERFL